MMMVPVLKIGIQKVLGPNIGYMPQGVELFSGSVAENIARFQKVVLRTGDRGSANGRCPRINSKLTFGI